VSISNEPIVAMVNLVIEHETLVTVGLELCIVVQVFPPV